MKGKVSFIGVDAPKDVFEFEIPCSDKPAAPPGYHLLRQSGIAKLTERTLDGGKLVISWSWNPKPGVRPEGGFPCDICGKSIPTKAGRARHVSYVHGGRP